MVSDLSKLKTDNEFFGFTRLRNDGKPSIRSRLEAVCNVLDELYVQFDAKTAEMGKLKAQGLSYAQPYWMRKDDPGGKPDQLELTHSTNSTYYQRHGTRRQYIGVKPRRIKAALEAIERGQEYLQIEQECERIKQKIARIEQAIDRLDYTAQAKQTSFLDYWHGHVRDPKTRVQICRHIFLGQNLNDIVSRQTNIVQKKQRPARCKLTTELSQHPKEEL